MANKPKGNDRHTLTNKNYETMTGMCSICGTVKLYSKGFRYGKDKPLQVRCSNAAKLEQTGSIVRLKEKVNEYKLSKGCYLCGYKKYAGALDFHHVNNDKDGNIGNMIRRRNYKKLWKEIDKCQVVCSNCHREIHHMNKRKPYHDLLNDRSFLPLKETYE
jgi:hypothetical protein